MYRGDTVSIYSISVQISYREEEAHKFWDLHARIILFILKIKIKNCLKEMRKNHSSSRLNILFENTEKVLF